MIKKDLIYRPYEKGAFLLNNAPYTKDVHNGKTPEQLNKENVFIIEDLNAIGLTNDYWLTNDSNISIAYLVDRDTVCLDVDSKDDSDKIDFILDKLGIKTYNYVSNPIKGKKHFWFRCSSPLLMEFRDKYSISNAKQLWLKDVDTRGFNIQKETPSGRVFVREKTKDCSTRPTPHELIDNLKDLPQIPLILLVQKKWIENFKFVMPYNTSEERSTYDEEFNNIRAMKKIGMSFEFWFQLHKETIAILNCIRRERDDNEYEMRARWDSCNTQQVETMQLKDNEVIYKDWIKSPELLKKLGIFWYGKEYWITEYSNHKYTYVPQADFNNVMNFRDSVRSYMVNYVESNKLKLVEWVDKRKEYVELDVRNISIENAVMREINHYFTHIEPIDLDNQLMVFQDKVIDKNLNVVEGNHFSLQMMPFKFDDMYISKDKYNPKMVELLETMFKDKDRLNEFLGTCAFGLSNRNSGRMLIIQGKENSGKTLLANMLSALIGKNVSVLNTRDVFESAYTFAFRDIALKTLVLGEELTEDINDIIINELKSKISDGDTIPLNKKNSNMNACDNTQQYVFNTNHTPIFPIHEAAMLSRIQFYSVFKNPKFVFEPDWIKDIDPRNPSNYMNWAPTFFSMLFEAFRVTYKDYKSVRGGYLKHNDNNLLLEHSLKNDKAVKAIMRHLSGLEADYVTKVLKGNFESLVAKVRLDKDNWPSPLRNKTINRQFEKSADWLLENQDKLPDEIKELLKWIAE